MLPKFHFHITYVEAKIPIHRATRPTRQQLMMEVRRLFLSLTDEQIERALAGVMAFMAPYL